jgi:tetratricopeptide (TPR) repeat protein
LAVADYLAVVKRDPSNKLAWYDLGVIAHQAGQDTEAAKDYQAALAADPHYVPALYNLAILKTATDPKTAEQLYETAAEVEPKNAKVHLNLGFVLKMLGQDAKGNAEISQAVKLDPSLAPRVPTGTLQPG